MSNTKVHLNQSTATIRQYFATVLGCFSFALVGYAAGWPSPVIMKMKNNEAPLTLDPEQMSWMVSLMYIGHLVSPVPSGHLMERVGRRKACLMLASLPLMSWLLVWQTYHVSWLYIARFISGLWAGAVSTIVPLYIGEIAEPRLRSSLNVFNHLMRNFGVSLVYIIGPFVSYRILAITCALLTIAFTFTFSLMPESPYHLVLKKRNEEAYKSLCWLRASKGTQINKELDKIKSSVADQTKTKGSLRDVWNGRASRKALIISQVYAVCKRLTGSGVLQAYVSLTLPKSTFHSLSPNDCVIIFGLISLMSSIASVYLSVHISRRLLVTISSAGCGITMACVSVWFYLDSHSDTDVSGYSDWLFLAYVTYNAMFSLGLGPVGTSVKGELFAANVKAICSSLTTVLVAVTSFVLNKFFLVIATSLGMYVNFAVYALSCFFVIVFTWYYVPDTHGKTLQEIQNLLGSEKKESSKFKLQ